MQTSPVARRSTGVLRADDRRADLAHEDAETVTASEWGETLIGFVIPTGAVIWGILILWRWSSPETRRPSAFAGGVIEFVLTCVLVVLIILGWELFKTWRRQVHAPLPPRTAENALQVTLGERAEACYLDEDRAGADGVREYTPRGWPDGSVKTAMGPAPSGRLNGT